MKREAFTNIQIHKYTNTQIHKYTNTQILKYTIDKHAAHTSSWQFTWIKVTQMMMIRFSSELIPILQVCYSWESFESLVESFESLVESFESLVEKVRLRSFYTECQQICYFCLEAKCE